MFASKTIWLRSLHAAMLALGGVVAVHAQVAPSAIGGGQSLWVGGEYFNVHAGFPAGSGLRLSGVGVFGTFNWNHRIGVDANADFLHFNSFHGETESSYMAGPRYTFLHSYKWRPFALLQVGAVNLNYPFQIGSYSYFAIAPGGGVEYRLNSKWLVKAEYRYEILPDSPNFTDEPQFGIKPNGFQLGVAYRLRGWETRR